MEQLLSENEYEIYEDEIMNQKFSKVGELIKKYPNDIKILFAEIMPYVFGNDVKELLILFINNGININDKFKFESQNDPPLTYLEWAAQNRLIDNIEIAFEFGADPNINSLDNMVLIDFVIQGRRALDVYSLENIYDTLIAFDKLGIKKVMHNWVYNDFSEIIVNSINNGDVNEKNKKLYDDIMSILDTYEGIQT